MCPVPYLQVCILSHCNGLEDLREIYLNSGSGLLCATHHSSNVIVFSRRGHGTVLVSVLGVVCPCSPVCFHTVLVSVLGVLCLCSPVCFHTVPKGLVRVLALHRGGSKPRLVSPMLRSLQTHRRI